jgi:hypothetical protein
LEERERSFHVSGSHVLQQKEIGGECVGVRAFVPVRKASTALRWFDSAMKAASAAIVITTAALVVLATQNFGGSNRDPAIAPATSSSLGMMGHNSPFQIVVAALHAAAHLLTTARPEARRLPNRRTRTIGSEQDRWGRWGRRWGARSFGTWCW